MIYIYMSKYLAKYYCGNKQNICNYQEPITYDKVLDRQFQMNCIGQNKTKGYCCDKLDNKLPINQQFLNNLNKKYNFYDNTKEQIPSNKFNVGNLPLVKSHKDRKGNLDYMEICKCPNYNETCIRDKCSGFSIPTPYELCKLGDFLDIDNTSCITTKEVDQSCQLKDINDIGNENLASIKINNLRPDCYLNLCNVRGSGNEFISYEPDGYYKKKADGFMELGKNDRTKIVDFLL